MIAGVAAALVLVCAVAAIPVSRKLMRKDAPAATPQATAPAAQAEAPSANDAANAPLQVNASDAVAAEDAAAVARREQQQQREARERARKAREEAAATKNAVQDQTLTSAAPKPATPAGAKTVRVQISYDEAGRVTQASAIGTSPGAEAYASTAVRVARSRHFAPGKAGSTVVTIPIN